MTALADATMFLIGSAAMLATPAYFILQPWAAARLTGGLAEGGAAAASPGNSASSLVQLRLCRSF